MPKDFYGFIYCTINVVNRSYYIGRHKCNHHYLVNELKSHPYIGSGIALRHAINKYGRHNFVCVIFDYAQSDDELNDKEKYWISYYNAQSNESFYNISNGGENWDNIRHNPNYDSIIKKMSLSRKGKSKTLEHRLKIGKSHKGYVPTPQTRAKISLASSGRPSPMKGKSHTEEAKEKMRQATLSTFRERGYGPMKGKRHTEEAKEKMRQATLSKYKAGWQSPMKGKHLSEETKEKIRQSNLRYNGKRGKPEKPITKLRRSLTWARKRYNSGKCSIDVIHELERKIDELLNNA